MKRLDTADTINNLIINAINMAYAGSTEELGTYLTHMQKVTKYLLSPTQKTTLYKEVEVLQCLRSLLEAIHRNALTIVLENNTDYKDIQITPLILISQCLEIIQQESGCYDNNILITISFMLDDPPVYACITLKNGKRVNNYYECLTAELESD